MILIVFINILLQVSKSEDCSKFGPHCSTCENGHCSKCDDGYGMDNDLSSENRGKCVECAYNPSPQGSCKNCNNDISDNVIMITKHVYNVIYNMGSIKIQIVSIIINAVDAVMFHAMNAFTITRNVPNVKKDME